MLLYTGADMSVCGAMAPDRQFSVLHTILCNMEKIIICQFSLMHAIFFNIARSNAEIQIFFVLLSRLYMIKI